MQTSPNALAAMLVGFNTRFQGSFTRTSVWWDQIATEVISSTAEETYFWVKELTGLREWIGERQVENLASQAYSIKNKDYEKTISVPRNDVEDDRFGRYAQRLDLLGAQAKKWPDDLVLKALTAGLTELCYDGQYFFDTDHPVDVDDGASGTWQNKFALPLTPENYGTVRAAMMSIKGSNGRPLGIVPNLLVCGPANEIAAKNILQNDLLINAAGTATGNNIYKGTASLLVIPEISDLRWYVMSTNGMIKPFVFQLRKPIGGIVSLTAPTDKNVFWDREFIYGVDGRGAAGFTLPFLAATSKP